MCPRPTIWCRTCSFAPSPNSICGSQGRICGPGFSRWCTTFTSTKCERGTREGIAVPVEDAAAALTVDAKAGPSLQLRDLDRALAHLPAEQRQVILLVGLEGMRYEEVATIFGIPIDTVRSRLSRGRDTLRFLMGTGEKTSGAPAPRETTGSPSQRAA